MLGESLKIGCHYGEISLSGRAENFTPLDRCMKLYRAAPEPAGNRMSM